MLMEEYNQYWEKHKNDYAVELPKRGIQSRLNLFRKHLKNKIVLHIGCSDWPDTEEKIENKDLLHQYLGNIAAELYGLDVSAESVGIMKKGEIKNVFAGDLYFLHNDKNLSDKKFDALLISEVIEHLVNPGLALESIRKYVLKTNPKCEVIFTVPNYQNLWYNFTSGLTGKEVVNSDHKYYFSYRTFRTLIENYNFEVNDFYFATYGEGMETLKGRIFVKLFSKIFQCLLPYLYFKCHVGKQGFRGKKA